MEVLKALTKAVGTSIAVKNTVQTRMAANCLLVFIFCTDEDGHPASQKKGGNVIGISVPSFFSFLSFFPLD
jgi:hypothetical protein